MAAARKRPGMRATNWFTAGSRSGYPLVLDLDDLELTLALGQQIDLHIGDIGLPPQLKELDDITLTLVDAPTVAALLPKRPRNAYKGTFGKALVVAGSLNYTGAAYMAEAPVPCSSLSVDGLPSLTTRVTVRLMELMTTASPEAQLGGVLSMSRSIFMAAMGNSGMKSAPTQVVPTSHTS